MNVLGKVRTRHQAVSYQLLCRPLLQEDICFVNENQRFPPRRQCKNIIQTPLNPKRRADDLTRIDRQEWTPGPVGKTL